MHYRRLPSLFVALFLQFSPLVRTFQPVLTGILQPIAALLRLATAATAMAGGAHALSGATGLLSAGSVRGTNGVALSYRAQISSTEYGAAKSYKIISGAPAGMKITSITLGSVSGTITATPGIYLTTFRGYQNNNQSGFTFDAVVDFTIVGVAPTITQDPLTQTVNEGDNVTLSVVVKSVGETPTYQWIKDGIELDSRTDSSIVFSPVTIGDQGSYTCRVENSGGIAVSGPGVLTVNPAAQSPVIQSFVASPADTLHPGETLTLTVAATAGSALSYQWFLDTHPVAGATDPTLVVPKVGPGNSGSYTVTATANSRATTSAPIVVALGPSLVAGTPTPGAAATTIPFGAIVGRHYFLETSTAFDASSWTPVVDQVASDANASLVDPTASDAEIRLYRIRVQ